VKGIWPPGADGSDINSTDRHTDDSVLATADDFGLVKIFNAPCVKVRDRVIVRAIMVRVWDRLEPLVTYI
jgi:hypothetical protein